MPLITCPECGKQYSDSASACPQCGYTTEKNQNTNSINNVISVNVSSDTQKPLHNKFVALLLCIFLGFLGAHKFYEGKTGMGIIYLLTAGLFGIGWFIDIIVLIFKPNRY